MKMKKKDNTARAFMSYRNPIRGSVKEKQKGHAEDFQCMKELGVNIASDSRR